jgi:hypothetical protein
MTVYAGTYCFGRHKLVYGTIRKDDGRNRKWLFFDARLSL